MIILLLKKYITIIIVGILAYETNGQLLNQNISNVIMTNKPVLNLMILRSMGYLEQSTYFNLNNKKYGFIDDATFRSFRCIYSIDLSSNQIGFINTNHF